MRYGIIVGIVIIFFVSGSINIDANEYYELKVNRKGKDISISSNINNNTGDEFIINAGLDTGRNKVFNFNDIYRNKKLIHKADDDIAPIWTFDKTFAVGANHGYITILIKNNEKIYNDVGSIWTDGKNEYILISVDDNIMQFLYPYKTKLDGNIELIRKMPTKSLRLKGDFEKKVKVDIEDIIESQLYPSIKNHKIEYLLDEKQVEEGINRGNRLDVIESYEILDYSSIYETLKKSKKIDLDKIDSVLKITNKYIFLEQQSIILENKIEVLENTEINKVVFNQSKKLEKPLFGNVKQYIANSKDFKFFTKLPKMESKIEFRESELEDKDELVNYQIQSANEFIGGKNIFFISGNLTFPEVYRKYNTKWSWELSNKHKNYGVYFNTKNSFKKGSVIELKSFKKYKFDIPKNEKILENKIYYKDNKYIFVNNLSNKKDVYVVEGDDYEILRSSRDVNIKNKNINLSEGNYAILKIKDNK